MTQRSMTLPMQLTYTTLQRPKSLRRIAMGIGVAAGFVVMTLNPLAAVAGPYAGSRQECKDRAGFAFDVAMLACGLLGEDPPAAVICASAAYGVKIAAYHVCDKLPPP